MGIVDVTLVFIVEDIVGFLHGFKFGFGGFSLGFGDFVWVTGECGLSHHIVSYEAAHIAVDLTLRYAFRTSSLEASLVISRTSVAC